MLAGMSHVMIVSTDHPTKEQDGEKKTRKKQKRKRDSKCYQEVSPLISINMFTVPVKSADHTFVNKPA